MAHPGLPKPQAVRLSKENLLQSLMTIDQDQHATARVLTMETDFRQKIENHLQSLPTNQAKFAKFFTNPFVLMIHSFKKRYHFVSQIEDDILPAKVFSSMETSAGRMIEEVVLPIYNWCIVPSAMHSANSALDGKQLIGNTLRLATLKSGPRCLNDEMSENFADAIIANSTSWANEAEVSEIDFTYGVLYGTKKQSNKKDWHILRNLEEKQPEIMIISPRNRWKCKFKLNEITVTVTVRIGMELWNWIAGHDTAFIEICTALIRACISPTDRQRNEPKYSIQDLDEIVSIEGLPSEFNVSILQRGQLEWLFFFARHFCDVIENDLH